MFLRNVARRHRKGVSSACFCSYVWGFNQQKWREAKHLWGFNSIWIYNQQLIYVLCLEMRYIPNIQFNSNEEHYDNSLSYGVITLFWAWLRVSMTFIPAYTVPAISGSSAQPCRKVDWSWDGRSAVRRESYSNSELNQHKEKKLTGRFVWRIWLRWVDGIYIYTIQCVLRDIILY